MDPDPAILAAVETALKTHLPEGDGPQAANFAKLRSARAAEIAKAIPADAAKLAELTSWQQQHASKIEQFPAMEKFYAATAVKLSDDYKAKFLAPLETAKADLKDLASGYGINEQRLGELLAMDPKARRTALEKDVSISFASDFDSVLRQIAKAEKAIAAEDERLGSVDHTALLTELETKRASHLDPNSARDAVIAELSASDDPFFKSDEGKALLAGLKGQPIEANAKVLATAAIKAAAFEKLKGQLAAAQQELATLKKGSRLFTQAKSVPGGTPAPGGGGKGAATPAPAGTGTFN